MQVLMKKDLEDFKLWLEEQGIAYRLGKGQWQVLQVDSGDFGFQVLFCSKHTEWKHFTSNDKLCPTIERFYESRA